MFPWKSEFSSGPVEGCNISQEYNPSLNERDEQKPAAEAKSLIEGGRKLMKTREDFLFLSIENVPSARFITYWTFLRLETQLGPVVAFHGIQFHWVNCKLISLEFPALSWQL